MVQNSQCEFAFVAGEQPDGLTSDYLIKSGVPAVWSEQRAQFARR
jgi:site-specific DNA recombinase